MTTQFVIQQQQFKYRAKVRRSSVFWPARNGTYDPFKKLEKAWDEWDRHRKCLNDARQKQLAISRGTAGDSQ